MNNFDWAAQFKIIYNRALQTYPSGNQRPGTLFSPDDLEFLKSIGCNAQELFDFVEDGCTDGEPSYETALLVTAVRRDYFNVIQKKQPSGKVISMETLPPKNAPLEGIAWLPRIIAKAEAKLRGEMPPELMYGCGGDRAFLRNANFHPADFLRLVWAADGNHQKILSSLRQQDDLATPRGKREPAISAPS